MTVRGWCVGVAVLVASTVPLPAQSQRARADALPQAAAIGELRLRPTHPRPGTVVYVEYRPGSTLRGEHVVALRARFRTARSGLSVRRQLRVTLLARRGQEFRGSFRVPDSAVYAALGVEDVVGERIEYPGVPWALETSGSDGRVAEFAYQQAALDVESENSRRALAIAEAGVRAYPESPSLRWMTLSYRLRGAAEPVRDSGLATERTTVRRLGATLEGRHPTASDEMAMADYAELAGEPSLAASWRARIVRDHPRDPMALRVSVLDSAAAFRSDPARALKAYEALWQSYGAAHPQLPFSAFSAAQRARIPTQIRAWGLRLEAVDPDQFGLYVARVFAAEPALSADALPRIRHQIARLTGDDDTGRPLDESVGEYRAETARAAAPLFAVLGNALLRSGEHAAALDTLDRALAVSWLPGVLRSVVDLRLAAGDTAGALFAAARLVVDPATSQVLADSLRARFGLGTTDSQWQDDLRAAHRDLDEYIARQVINRSAPFGLRLADSTGAAVLVPLGQDRPTLVALWSRFCQPSFMQLPALETLTVAARARGDRVVTITDERPSAELTDFLQSRKLTFPLFHDVEWVATSALTAPATPTYLVVDLRGRLRFVSHQPDDVLRVLAALDPEP